MPPLVPCLEALGVWVVVSGLGWWLLMSHRWKRPTTMNAGWKARQ